MAVGACGVRDWGMAHGTARILLGGEFGRGGLSADFLSNGAEEGQCGGWCVLKEQRRGRLRALGCCAAVELLDWGWGGGAVDGTARRGERRCALKTKATGAKRRASVFQARRANGGVTQVRWCGQPWSAGGGDGVASVLRTNGTKVLNGRL